MKENDWSLKLKKMFVHKMLLPFLAWLSSVDWVLAEMLRYFWPQRDHYWDAVETCLIVSEGVYYYPSHWMDRYRVLHVSVNLVLHGSIIMCMFLCYMCPSCDRLFSVCCFFCAQYRYHGPTLPTASTIAWPQSLLLSMGVCKCIFKHRSANDSKENTCVLQMCTIHLIWQC